MEKAKSGIGIFEKYLTLWVALCIGGGILIGSIAGESMQILSSMEIYRVKYPGSNTYMVNDLSNDVADRFFKY